MCGFTGFYGNNVGRGDLLEVGRAMTTTLTHRGPDDQGVWRDPDVPLVLGHRRLSIIDTSDNGHQPMQSASGRYMIVYNGEIYNFKVLRAALEQAGYRFRGDSDTEVLLGGFDQWGFEETLKRINGMFALALWDRKARTLYLVRDRFGQKPLYVGWAGASLVFGSELKALRAHPDFQMAVDQEALSLFLRYGYVPAPHCIDQNVWQVPPGHYMRLKMEDVTGRSGRALPALMTPYWQAKSVIRTQQAQTVPPADAGNAVSDLKTLLKTCVQDRMVSDVPLGAFLSGGIDSTAVVALMQDCSGRPVKTYTIGFEESDYNEAAHARTVARHLGTDHHELYVRPGDARDIIPALPAIYDEPFADISAIPMYALSRFAGQAVRVALSGDGGDELFGGYARHVKGPSLWRYGRVLPHAWRRSLASLIMSRPGRVLYARKPQLETRLHKLSRALEAGSSEAFYRSFLEKWDAPPLSEYTDPYAHDFFDTQENYTSLAAYMMAQDTSFYLPHSVLTKVDRASMAASLEVRSPFLDVRLFEYAWTVPEALKIRNGQGKQVLRQLLTSYIPVGMFNRPKQGFSLPVGPWLRTALRDWAEHLLDRQKLAAQGYLDPDAVRKVWTAHLNGHGACADKLWTVLMFQAWLDRWH